MTQITVTPCACRNTVGGRAAAPARGGSGSPLRVLLHDRILIIVEVETTTETRVLVINRPTADATTTPETSTKKWANSKHITPATERQSHAQKHHGPASGLARLAHSCARWPFLTSRGRRGVWRTSARARGRAAPALACAQVLRGGWWCGHRKRADVSLRSWGW